MKRQILFSLIVLFSLQASVYAHESVKSYNQISLEASSFADVDNDIMMVSMYAQEEGLKATVLSDAVNKKINWALAKLKQHKTIKVETENYTTSPVYRKSQIVSWRVRQSIKLESSDMSLMSEVLGDLQAQLKLNGISFDVSRDKKEQNTKLLIDEALDAFTLRAKQIANKLQHDSYKIVNIHVSTSGNNTLRYKSQSMSVMAEARVAPEFSAGDRTLSARVSGSIELQ
jgi:predicted secreted protein